jgi:replicative DNA helicase
MVDQTLANLDAERAFIATIGWASAEDPAKAKRLLDGSLVTADRMFFPAHRDVLEVASELLARGNPVDAIVLSAKLSGNETVQRAGGAAWLTELMGVSSFEHLLPEYAAAIRDMALRRKLVAIANDMRAAAYTTNQEAGEVLAKVTSSLASITLSKRQTRTLSDVLTDCIDEMEAVRQGRATRIVPTGLVELDAILGGGLPPTLIVLGAFCGVGKSALFATICQRAARTGTKVGIFSLEDEARWLGWRILSAESDVPQGILRNKPLRGTQELRVQKAIDRVAPWASNLLIDDRCKLEPAEIAQTATDWIVNHGARLILVDHIGEVRLPRANKDRHDLALTDALIELRDVAKARGVPVVVASHLTTKGKNTDPSDKPRLDSFKNTSSLENMARVALGLSREPDSDTLNVHVLKNTNGRVGDLQLKFVGIAGMVADCEGAQQRAEQAGWYRDTVEEASPQEQARMAKDWHETMEAGNDD